MSHFTETWPLARASTLKALYAAGITAKVIAERLSLAEKATITRNMVCGKINRLNLTARKPTEADIQARKDRLRIKNNERQRKKRGSITYYLKGQSHPPRAEKMRMSDAPALPPLNLTLADLSTRDGRPVECRWITNDDMALATYCGRVVHGESSWCPHHHGLAHKAWVRTTSPPLAPRAVAA